MNNNKFYEPKQDYKVLCHCLTYNQAQYKTDTMNGFTMQKTNFPFMCYIIDDASSDGYCDEITAYLNDNFDWGAKLLYSKSVERFSNQM